MIHTWKRTLCGLTALPIMRLMILAIMTGSAAVAQSNDGKTSIKHLFESKDSYMGAVATKIAEFKETGDIWSLDFSPGGEYLAASDPGRIEVHIWKWQGTSRIVRTLYKPHGTGLVTSGNGVRYSPDGHLIVAFHARAAPEDGNSVVRVWATDTGHVVADISEPVAGGWNSGLAFSPDGSMFIRSIDRMASFPGDQLIVHSTTTWAPIWGLRTIPFYPQTLALSLDGKRIALGGADAGPGIIHQCKIIIVDSKQHSVLRTINAFPVGQTIQRLAWKPDGIHIAAGVKLGGTMPGPDAVKVFNTETGEVVADEQARSADMTMLAYSSNGKYLVESGVENKIRIWDSKHENLLQEIPINAPAGYTAGALALSRDSRYLAIANVSDIDIWEFH